ncbi:MAG: outer membrane porin GjpA [Actinobacteria bacterium]|nr:outer membrane porin GjpA [Actinomycetota bacterium]
MNVSARSYLTAGAAALSATAIAMAPIQPIPEGSAITPQRVSTTLAVNLAAAVDPFTLLVETIQTSADNITGLFNAVTDNPLPIIQQVIANLETYISELPNIGLILDQVIGNVGNAVRSPFAVPASCSGEDVSECENISTVPVTTVPILGELSQQNVYALLPLLLGDSYDSLRPILEFTTTPVSGALLSLVGPVVAPVLSVVNSIGAVIDYLGSSDFQSAIFELINLPTNAVGAFLNGGQFLDLAPVLSLVGVTLPSEITSLGLQMGGLLSPGGVMFDGLAAEASIPNPLAPLPPPTIDIVDLGLPVGPIGSLIGLTNYVANSIAVTPPAEAPVEIAAAVEPPAAAPLEVDAPAPATAPEAAVAEVAEVEVSAPAEVADPVSAPAQEVADAADTTPSAPRASSRSGRGGEAASSARTGSSTPKRAARGAASRG